MRSKDMIIAIDGPAGAGKSTVCRLLARTLGCAYLDTGAMYRAIAWALIQTGCGSVENDPGQCLPSLPLHFDIENGGLTISFEGRRLGDELRAPEISHEASRISQLPSVRAFLTRCQRLLADRGKVVAEGRDMTTVVFPDAPVKIFLTADLPTRARRRFAEYRDKGISVDYESIEDQIRARDTADEERALAPLRAAPDALVMDTSNLTVPQVVSRLLEWISERAGNDSDARSC